MAKVKIETITRLAEQAVKDNIEIIKIGELDGRDVNIEINKTITMEDFNSVCAALSVVPFAEAKEGFTSYVPSGEVMAFQVSLIKAFTNIELPENVTEAYELCSKSNLFQKVHSALAGTDQYSDLLIIARKYSDFHRLVNSFSGLFDSIGDAITSIDANEVFQNILSTVTSTTASVKDA